MSKEAIERKNDLIERAQKILDTAKAETRELTPDEAQELAEIRDDVKAIKAALGIEEEINQMLEEEGEHKDDNTPEEETVEEKRSIEEMETRAFEEYVRSLANGEFNERTNNMTKGDNGAIIPTTIANRIIKKVYDICPILERSQKYNVKGTLEIPYYDEGTTAITVAYAEEFNSLGSNVGAFSSVTLTGFLAGALSLISRSLINNAQFNLTDFIVDQMAYSIKRFIEKELLYGTPAAGSDPAKVLGLNGVSLNVTAAATGAVTADELIALHDKIVDDYQGEAIWIMSPATRTAVRQLKDEVGRYLLQDDISAPFGATLLGRPVYVSDQMEDMAASKVAIYYGDMSGLATKFNEEINIQVLRERYADMHAVGVIGWFEFDAKVQDAQKVAKLTMHSA